MLALEKNPLVLCVHRHVEQDQVVNHEEATTRSTNMYALGPLRTPPYGFHSLSV